MKQELFIDPCSKFIHSVFVAVSTAEKRTREIGNKNCSTVFPKKTSKKNIATKNPSYGRTCIKNVKALCNCLGALSVKLGTSCFCLFAFFSSLQSSLSALLAICNCTSAFCDTCLSGRFFRFAVGHVHYVLRQCCRVVPCEVACDRAKASPGFTPARESHVFLLIPRHHLQPAIRFQSSVHLKQTTQSLVKDWGKVLHSLNLEPILEAQSVTKRRKAFSSWWDNQLLSASLNAMTVGQLAPAPPSTSPSKKPARSPKERLWRWWARTGQVLEGQNAARGGI